MQSDGGAGTSSGLDGTIIGILMPTFNDWAAVGHLIPRLAGVLQPLGVHVRIVIVDDGSSDSTGKDRFEQLVRPPIRSIDEIVLSRNQGNQRAIAIGMGYVAENVPCDVLVVMDSDHEDQPEDVARLLRECADHGHRRIIVAARTARSEGLAFRVLYRLYRRIFRIITGYEVSFGNFCAMPRALMLRLSHAPDLWNQFPAAIIRSRLPFSKMAARRGRRFAGASTMNLVGLIGHAFSGFAVFADVIATRAVVAGAAAAGLLGVLSLLVIYLRFFTKVLVPGWSTLVIGIMILLLAQIIGTSFLLSFAVALSRAQPPLIPAQAYRNFVVDVDRHGDREPTVSGGS